jgi:hypothetical protein
MPAPNIRITELDYDQILQNLVEFMKADPSFSDYDFAGSGLRMLARVLAYVTFYNNYYVTAAVNEAFLDTAQLRSSVSSHARMLGYMMKGTQSARLGANVAVEMENTSASTVTLPKNSRFVLGANNAFSFYNLADTTLTLNVDTALYEAADVLLIEGDPLQYRFTVNINDPAQRFIIPAVNIDFTSITVKVQQSASSNVVTTFVRDTNFLTIGADDPVFFVQEAYNGFPQVVFGNGVVGRPVQDQNVVIVDYYVSKGDEANSIRGPFTIEARDFSGFVRGATFADANTLPSSGGAAAEDIDKARFLAPLAYQAQNRCVTAQDYKTIILAAYGEHIGAINVFGGEQGDPGDPRERPLYGRVFIAVKPKIGLRFTSIIRGNIEQNIIKPHSVIGVIPQVIDPDYIYLNVSTSVKYDPKATTRTKLQLQEVIRQNIITFAEQNIEKFDTAFRFSKFTRIIDDTDDAIVSSLTRLDLEKRIYPQLGTTNQFILKFGAAFRKSGSESSLLETTSHRFTYTNIAGVTQAKCFFYEQSGVLHVAYRDTNNKIVLHQQNIGSVDATKGLVVITAFKPDAIENGDIDVRMRVIPAVNDFVPRLNQLFTVDPDEIAVQLLNDATANLSDEITFFQGGVLP